ncbi:MAG: hydroxymethylglutaryl-CoA synthase [Candidatus Asgardarchaeum sp.]
MILKPKTDIAIHGWGVYIPRYRISSREIARIWGQDPNRIEKGLMLKEKAIAGPDEDTATLSVEATLNAIKRARIKPNEIGGVFVGSESHPYYVKSTASTVAEAIGATPYVVAASLEFACKAGTDAMLFGMGLVGSGMIKYALAIGADIAQGAPGDALEYSAGGGAVAYIVGEKNENSAAIIEAAASYVTDTPDFWRRPYEKYPKHGEAFTGEPAYFRHIISASKILMDELGYKPSDFKYAIFHQPNGKFPLRAAKALGFSEEQVRPGLITPVIGNTYAASSILGLAAVLDIANPGEKIIITSFGSGAGSDAFIIEVQDAIKEKQNLAPKVRDYIERKIEIDYGLYVKFREKIEIT